MLTSDVISLHIQREMRKNLIGDLIVSFHEKKVKFKDVVIEENEISIKHQNLSNLNFDAYIDIDGFNKIIKSEVSIEWIRIKEQINNIENLLRTKSQPAWIVVSVYYCCFFMANLISKVYGKSLVNFSGENLKELYKRSNTESVISPDLRKAISEISDGNNNVYSMSFIADKDNEVVKVQFLKSGDQPHKFTWTNFKSILNQVGQGKCGGRAIPNIVFMKKICDSSEYRWPLPSQIRNDWNYSSTTSFATSGTQLAEDFIRFLKNPANIEMWETRMCHKTEGNEKDKLVSIAYMYLVLKDVISQLIVQNDIEFDLKRRVTNTSIKVKQDRAKKKTRR